MTFEELCDRVMRQCGEDLSDMPDYGDLVPQYLNEGYMKLMDKRLSGAISGVERLTDGSTPALPEHAHPAIADYATWLMYRNGNPVKQQRGQAYLASFNEALLSLKTAADEALLASGLRMRNLYCH